MKIYLLGVLVASSMCVDSANGKSLVFMDFREFNMLTLVEGYFCVCLFCFCAFTH